MSSGGEGAGAGARAGGAPGQGSVRVVGHVEGLPGGPRVVPAALVLAQRRQPVHLRRKEMSVTPVGYGPRSPPVPGDTASRVPQLMGTQSQLSPVPLQQHSPWYPPPKETEPSVSPISQGTTLVSPLTPWDVAFGISLPIGTEPSRSHIILGGTAHPIGNCPLTSPIPLWGHGPHCPPHSTQRQSAVSLPRGPWSLASCVLWGMALGVSCHPVGHSLQHPPSQGAQSLLHSLPCGQQPMSPSPHWDAALSTPVLRGSPPSPLRA